MASIWLEQTWTAVSVDYSFCKQTVYSQATDYDSEDKQSTDGGQFVL